MDHPLILHLIAKRSLTLNTYDFEAEVARHNSAPSPSVPKLEEAPLHLPEGIAANCGRGLQPKDGSLPKLGPGRYRKAY